MSTKPTTVPLFDTNLTNASAPIGSKITDGYPTNSPLPSSDLNFQLGWLGAWAQYLNDQVFAGTVTLNGAVLNEVTKTLNATENDLDLSAGLNSLASVLVVNITPHANGSTITGIKNGVVGRTIILYNSSTSVNDDLQFNHLDAGSLIANRLTFPNAQGVQVPKQTFVVLRYGADNLWHLLFTSARKRVYYVGWHFVPAAYTNKGTTMGNEIIGSGDTDPRYFPLPTAAGDNVVGWGCSFAKNTSSSHTVTAVLGTLDASGNDSAIATVTNSDNAPGLDLISESGVVHTISGPTFIKFIPSGSIAPAADRLYYAYVIINTNT